MTKVVLVLGILVVLVLAIRAANRPTPNPEATKLLQEVDALAKASDCTIQKITVQVTEARIVDECHTRACPVVRGAAILHNGCIHDVGVEVRVIGLDSTGTPIAVRKMWPASTTNIPPGSYPFSLDSTLDADARIKTVRVEPVSLTRWK